ncbi:hypothetical protein [Streptomyces sp. HNM0574]|uniref:hypothetical protein n=1 Tax=Streptomyces sp. HNM0574 TaxID=2714954 RepID=UPI00146A40FC|nr:hypothetical protein [Streptomyces sp. HNM0574]NLU69439.1 hypothetical protein [Streptomyces sp. HNM0574]
MTAPAPAHQDRREPRGGRARTVATVLSGLVLGALGLVTAGWLALAYGTLPEDGHDREALDGAGLGALFAIGFAVPTLLLTILPVALGWLRRRWFLPPAVLLLLAAVRYTYLVQVYDPW